MNTDGIKQPAPNATTLYIVARAVKKPIAFVHELHISDALKLSNKANSFL